MRSSRNRPEGADMPGVLLFLMLCATTWAADFAGGTGEPNDPYQIATTAQLISIGSDPNLQDKHFVLVADIDMDPNLPGGELLTYGLALSTGSLDGGGHWILNLGGLSAPGGVRAGTTYGSSLFERIGADAVVRDLKITGVSLKVPAMLAYENAGTVINCLAEGTVSRTARAINCGGLVANNSGNIIDCSVIGSIADDIADCAGGLAGANSGTIINCFFSGSVANDDGGCAGGLVGTNSGTVAHSHATGDVTGGSGLAGENSGTITACYATGDITDGPAGLVGDNSGTIRYCYATGDIYASGGLAGGLVATNLGGISYCYATGNVWAEDDAAGLVASNEGTISYCYATGSGGMALVAGGYDGTALNCYALAEADGGGMDDGFGIVLTDMQMRRHECFVGWDFAGTHLDGSFDHWVIPEDGGYPALTAIAASGCPGTGAPEDPYLVETHHQFLAIPCKPDACYQLAADINLQGQTFSEAVVPMFWGHLDGAGHSIFNFTLTGRSDLGLFGVLYPDAWVSNMSVQGVRIVTEGENPERMAGLAVRNRGTLIGCSSSTNVTAATRSIKYVGGMVAINEGGELRQCFARCSIVYRPGGKFRSSECCGGLAGHNLGTISESHASSYTSHLIAEYGALAGMNEGSIVDCYADGYISGLHLGGLVQSNSGSIVNCYATATVTPTSSGGSLVDESTEGAITDSYFLAEADGGGPDNGYGTALSAEEMRRQASFAGWDFENTWMICAGVDYPRLQWEGIGCED
jgi:The GLUG motif